MELFDKNGKKVDFNDAISDFLKENLEIQISTNTENVEYSDKKRHIIEVRLTLDGKEINKSKDWIYS